MNRSSKITTAITVEELIDQLSKFPPKHQVVVLGYESGYGDANSLSIRRIVRDVNLDDPYSGNHDDFDSSLNAAEELEYAVLIKTD